MSKSIEDSLRQLMYWAGHGIEKIIGKVQKAKVSVVARPGVQPILSLESQLALDKIQDLIAFAIERFYLPVIPHLEGKSCLEIGAGKPVFATQFLQKQAKAMITVNTGYGESPIQGDASRGFIVKAETHNLPFENDFFDYTAARLASSAQKDILNTIKEITRTLSPGGQGVFIDFHPFGLYAKKGPQRLLSLESNIKGLEDYYKICRTAGLRIMNIKEAFIDEGLRSKFSQSEIQTYRNIKGTPLIIFVFFFKPKVK
ncbi:MAG: methyltransferase domain-containing protein [Pseudomonadota bacterium]